jgi:hypothetical protein
MSRSDALAILASLATVFAVAASFAWVVTR